MNNMTLTLHNIKNKKKARKRIGRGNGSGRGTYSTRGQKGQRSRSGGKGGLKRKGFRQNLLNIPKIKGNKAINPKNQIVKLSELELTFKDGAKLNPALLFEKGLITKIDLPVKILFDKEISVKYEISDCLVSGKAREAIEKNGGKFSQDEKEISQDKAKK